jgi:hypothetical protein
MVNTTTSTGTAIEALIAAAGMTCFAEDCDIVVLKRLPRIAVPLLIEPEVTPPFAGA